MSYFLAYSYENLTRSRDDSILITDIDQLTASRHLWYRVENDLLASYKFHGWTSTYVFLYAIPMVGTQIQ